MVSRIHGRILLYYKAGIIILYSHSIMIKPTESYWDWVLVLLIAINLLDKNLDFLHAGNLQDIGQDFLHISFVSKIACNVALSFASRKNEETSMSHFGKQNCLKSHHSPAQWKWPMAIATDLQSRKLMSQLRYSHWWHIFSLVLWAKRVGAGFN